LAVACATIPNVIHPYSEPVSIETKTVEIQDELNPSAQISATQYKFPFVVRNIVVDATDMKALVRIKKPKDKPTKVPSILVYYDLIDNKVLWTKRSYAWNPQFLDNKIIMSGGGKILAANKRTGDMVWERTGAYRYINQEKNIAITGLLTAINLDTGADIWHRDIESQFGWDEIKIDDESLIASIDGLHTFDFRDGTGWDIDMSTGKKDELGAAAKNIGVGVLSGLSMAMGGGPVTGTIKANEFSGMVSNIFTCDGHIFFAAKDNLVCVEKETGKEIWRTNLPQKKTAKSVLLEDGESVVLANKSYCLKNGEFFRYGTPYIAKFDKTTGEQIFSEDLDTKLYIQDVQLTERGYYVITENELLQFGTDGKLNAKLDLSENNAQYGNNIRLLINNDSFIKNFVKKDQIFIPLENYLANPSIPALETEDGLLILDSDLDVLQWIPKNEIFYIVVQNDKTNLLRNVKYNSIKDEIRDLEWEIKFGSIAKNKSRKQRLEKIKEEGHDILHDVYSADITGKMLGKKEIYEAIVPTKEHFYFSTENGLTLVSKGTLK
jgi:outer membrane protein assembly factor BamB